jgi:hypothetical protein
VEGAIVGARYEHGDMTLESIAHAPPLA